MSSRFDKALAIGTAVFTAILAVVGALALRETKKALEHSQRAWVVPTGAKIDGPVEVGKVLRLKVLFENVGKEPAINMIHGWTWRTINISPNAHGEPYLDRDNVAWPRLDADACKVSVAERDGRPIYPTGRYEDIRYTFTGGEAGQIPQSLLDRKTTIVVFGCFKYEAFGKERLSPYCLYFQPHRTRPIESWTFEFCPYGDKPD